MSTQPDKAPFTGKHMAAILVAGFGVVVTVNFFMASLATGGFHGVVVENSYVASQNFNEWLDEAERNRALGWEAQAMRDDAGHVVVRTEGVPPDASLNAELRRPLGTREYADLNFVSQGAGVWRSSVPIKDGRWTIRLFIEAGNERWAQESELP